MPRPSSAVPAYLHHKPSGRAYVRLRTPDGGRRTVYLGAFGSLESRAEYARLVTDPSPNTPAAPAAGPTVAELLLAYLTYATGYYRDVATGEPSGYLDTVKLSARAIREPFAALPVAEFRPRHLTAVRDKLVASGLSRNEVNRRIGVAKKIFRWGMGPT